MLKGWPESLVKPSFSTVAYDMKSIKHSILAELILQELVTSAHGMSLYIFFFFSVSFLKSASPVSPIHRLHLGVQPR